MKINWYPGHMAKTLKALSADLKTANMVIQIRDARVPLSSINPEFERLFAGKKNILLLSKSDLADPEETKKWIQHFKKGENSIFAMNTTDPASVKQIKKYILKQAEELRREIFEKKGMRVTVRAIVAGIPNSGKSTFINAFFGKSKAKTGNKPGVTKDRQWIKDSPEFELMDTPGLLWPNLEDERVMLNLTITNAIKNELYDAYTLACEFLKCYQNILAPGVQSRYGVDINSISLPEEMLEEICNRKGIKKQGGINDTDRCAELLINDFRLGKLGRITLEPAPVETDK